MSDFSPRVGKLHHLAARPSDGELRPCILQPICIFVASVAAIKSKIHQKHSDDVRAREYKERKEKKIKRLISYKWSETVSPFTLVRFYYVKQPGS